MSFSNLSSLITSTKWASLLSLKFLERRGMSAEWSMPMAPPLHVFFSFSCSISHNDVWLFFKASSCGLSRPFRVFGLRPAETAGEHFRFEESWGQETVKQKTWISEKKKQLLMDICLGNRSAMINKHNELHSHKFKCMCLESYFLDLCWVQAPIKYNQNWFIPPKKSTI